MGRPKEHNAQSAAMLLATAERLVEAAGVEALSVRRVATQAGTTTRAVYSVFGSKEGLVVALGAQAFELLRTAIESLPVTDDPASDLVEAGVVVFRSFVLAHPALFRLGVQHTAILPELARRFRGAAEQALAGLQYRISRLAGAGRLGNRSVLEATCVFHGFCEGLAALELRGMLPPSEAERVWRDALAALVRGWCTT